jgi:hypothetical protein
MRALLTAARRAFRTRDQRRQDLFFERQRVAARESGWLL